MNTPFLEIIRAEIPEVERQLLETRADEIQRLEEYVPEIVSAGQALVDKQQALGEEQRQRRRQRPSGRQYHEEDEQYRVE